MQYSMSLSDCLIINSVQISVLEVWHDSVRLGIHDPSASPAYREEVLYLRSEDEGDDGDESDSAFHPLEIEDFVRCGVPAI